MKSLPFSSSLRFLRPLARRWYFACAAIAWLGPQTGLSVIVSYDVHQDFVDGEGSYDAYLDAGSGFNHDIRGSFAFELPSASDPAGGDVWHYRASTLMAPLTLVFGGATFDFSGTTDFFIDVLNEHIRIDFYGAEANAIFNFFGAEVGGQGPAFDPDPLINLSMLGEWSGYIDFHHSNGSHLYTDWGSNVGPATVSDVQVWDETSTAALFALALAGIFTAITRKNRRRQGVM